MKKTFLLKTMLLLCALVAGSASGWAEDVEIASATFNGKNATYTEGWTTTGTGKSRTDCVVIGKDENITSPSFDLTAYSKVTITFQARRFGSLSGSKATVDASIGGVSQGTIDITSTSVGTVSGNINFVPTESMTAVNIVFTCTNATSAGSTHGAGIGTITIMGTPKSGGGEVTKVATPIFTPGGNTYNVVQSVTISCETEGATIHYTTNGDDPTESDAIYSSAISVTKSGTVLKARAFKSGLTDSNIVSESYTIKPAKPTITATSNTVTITGPDGCDVFYTIDGTTPNQSSTKYTAPFELDEDCTIKARSYDEYDNAGDTYSYTFTYVVPVTLPFNWTGGGKEALNAVPGVTGSGLGSDYADSNAPYLVKLDGTNDYIQIYTDKQPTKVAMGVKMIGGKNTSTITVQESADGANFTDVQDLTISGSQNDILVLATTNTFASTTRAIKLVFTKGSNVGVGSISIFSEGDVPVAISATGWTSFSNASALDFTDTGVTPYTAKVQKASYVKLTSIDKVPASTGILVNAAGAGMYAIPVLTGDADAVADNELLVSDGNVEGNGSIYVLANKTAGVGFYKLANEVKVPAGKCYLDTAASAPEFLGFSFGGETTGISQIENGKLRIENVYNLNGQRVAQPSKGLYIMNGRKVVIK